MYLQINLRQKKFLNPDRKKPENVQEKSQELC